jgi:hypothetical protein
MLFFSTNDNQLFMFIKIILGIYLNRFIKSVLDR